MGVDSDCMCLEVFHDSYLGFHDVSNTLLHDLVTTILKGWIPGIRGVSMGVSSVLSDYISNMPKVIQASDPSLQKEKFIQLEGKPWTSADDSAEKLQMSIIACLALEGFRLSMDIKMDTLSKVFFFIRDKELTMTEVKLPSKAGAGLGEKGTLCVYRPTVVRTKSSFLRSYHGRTNSFKQKAKSSFIRKVILKHKDESPACERRTAMSYKPLGKEPAWWQQTSTDIASDASESEYEAHHTS